MCIRDRSDYKLPDGNVVHIHEQLIQGPECLFDPMLINKQLPGVHTMVTNTVTSSDAELCSQLISNVVVIGGSTLFTNFAERLELELHKCMPYHKLKVRADPDRRFAAYIGGCVLSSLSSFGGMWIHRYSDPNAVPALVGYDEMGPRIVHHMCA
eukprot:TRINITY_DN4851_c0_g1_i1.p1 TRINITY_DN4851_c0_g1~~TRINITY_DN4851_c0_g1_i1.p1  ORF type:complete len:154 (-),score=16.49 TRINITY_DN4851_c0_g1_i1:18-479(-)